MKLNKSLFTVLSAFKITLNTLQCAQDHLQITLWEVFVNNNRQTILSEATRFSQVTGNFIPLNALKSS